MGEILFSMEPEVIDRVETKFRKIVTSIPVPDSLPIIEKLQQYEPLSMSGQPLVLWDRAEGVNVYDPYGNKWLDMSSGVLVANVGHGRQEVRDAMMEQIERPLLHNYLFPCEIRARLVKRLLEISPVGLDKVFLLTTGGEAVECALKLARTHGLNKGDKNKNTIVSFENAFHGRTLGAQLVGGIPELKEWIVNSDPDIHHVPFPGDFRLEDRSFSLFEKTLKEKGVRPDDVAGVMSETYQGGGASFMPEEYAHRLREWCTIHGALLIFDEVQSSFGRTGKLFAFEHYGVEPDIIACGKGSSSCLPLSAVLSRPEIMDMYEPGSMTSTHTGNPVCCAATLASIDVLLNGGVLANAASVGKVLGNELEKLKDNYPDVIGALHGRGMVYGIHIVKKDSIEPDGELAHRITDRAIKKGLMLFAPVGPGGATIKICPPLIFDEEGVGDGIMALSEAFEAEVRV
ncbi:MAG: aminotransferase class III-fold pyridoxal phosphate-dependent enzyme [Desulfobacteraceae bacterium]|nr:MAG: aminotransferase class III-fold pyridoxal phosphate-dependent enzyme [Desulfobacteraceae bacterium]